MVVRGGWVRTLRSPGAKNGQRDVVDDAASGNLICSAREDAETGFGATISDASLNTDLACTAVGRTITELLLSELDLSFASTASRTSLTGHTSSLNFARRTGPYPSSFEVPPAGECEPRFVLDFVFAPSSFFIGNLRARRTRRGSRSPPPTSSCSPLCFPDSRIAEALLVFRGFSSRSCALFRSFRLPSFDEV